MPTYQHRNGKVTVTVRVKGYPATRSADYLPFRGFFHSGVDGGALSLSLKMSKTVKTLRSGLGEGKFAPN